MAEVPLGHTDISKNALSKKEKYWQNHYNRCQQSGLSLAAYARSQGLVVKTFYAWHWRLRQRGLVKPEPAAALFHRVTVKQTQPSSVKETELVSLRFRLPNGIDCEVSGISLGNCSNLLGSLVRISL